MKLLLQKILINIEDIYLISLERISNSFNFNFTVEQKTEKFNLFLLKFNIYVNIGKTYHVIKILIKNDYNYINFISKLIYCY